MGAGGGAGEGLLPGPHRGGRRQAGAERRARPRQDHRLQRFSRHRRNAGRGARAFRRVVPRSGGARRRSALDALAAAPHRRALRGPARPLRRRARRNGRPAARLSRQSGRCGGLHGAGEFRQEFLRGRRHRGGVRRRGRGCRRGSRRGFPRERREARLRLLVRRDLCGKGGRGGARSRSGRGAVYLAGRPGELETALRAAGVAEFIYAGGDMFDTLQRAFEEAV